jgi:nucleoside-diphosphate-sugar epimerase
MRILITGSRGNVGTPLAMHLQKQDHEVFGIDIVQGVGENYKVADINIAADLAGVFINFRPEVCFHLAAMVSRVTCEASPAITIQTNIAGTNNIVQLCKLSNTRLIYFSTSEVYGNIGGVLSEDRTDMAPNNLYGLSKLIGEQIIKYEVSRGLDAIIVRPFMLYHEDETIGDHRSAMVRFITDLIKGKQITVHDGAVRSWMHLDDTVRVLERLLFTKGFNIVNIGNPDYRTIDGLALIICSQLFQDYSSMVRLECLPDRMTLTKIPALEMQKKLSGIDSMSVSLEDGVVRVIQKIKAREWIR